jgi:hypothetical protein
VACKLRNVAALIRIEQEQDEKSAAAKGLGAQFGGQNETVSDDSTLSVDKLAEVFRVPKEALRKRLDRCREKDHTCFIEVADRNPRDPQFLYKVGKVRPIIESMRASGETSGERPAKKTSL